ncbi:MAG: dienelactone hydrolase family protein [Pseudohongiellaceae bacterium]
MCDDITLKDMNNYLRRQGHISRRQFGSLTAGAGLAMVLPPVANAQEVSESDVQITTPDGVADCHFVHPATGTAPGVIVWPDILGLRPAFTMMGRRLAQSGYAVLTVNPFYRGARAPVVQEGASFQDDETRNIVMPLAGQLNEQTHFTDARAFIGWLDQQSAVDTGRGIGTTGYCMGGPMVMRTVAAVPERMGAGATFHGGGLATDADNSPHLLIPQTRARMLHAIAANDDANNPEVKNILRQAYGNAGIQAEIEVYGDTQHGWCPPDSAVYDMDQAERAWSRLLALFDAALA